MKKLAIINKQDVTPESFSVLCYWAARELGISTVELSKRLGISQPTASQSVKRGEKVVVDKKLNLYGLNHINI
jgi:putative transposase